MTDALVPRGSDPADLTTLDGTIKIGQILAKSGFFNDAKEAAQCITKVLAGRELGFGPVASMVGIYLVKGRVTLSANLIAAAIKRSGRYNFRVRQLDDSRCEIHFFEGKEQVGVSAFSMADAERAGLARGDNWKAYPRNMLYARAMSNGAKWFTPDVFGGPVYTPDELGASVDGETGEILSGGLSGRQTVADVVRLDLAEAEIRPAPPPERHESAHQALMPADLEPDPDDGDGGAEVPVTPDTPQTATFTQLDTIRRLAAQVGREVKSPELLSRNEAGLLITELSNLRQPQRAGAGQ
jgi:hypothetical protein